MKKILVTTSSFAETSREAINAINKSEFDILINPYGRRLSNSEVIELIDDDVIGIIAGLEELSEKTLKNKNLKVISRVGSGTSNIDFKFVDKNNIKVLTTPFGPVNAVAEITVCNMISLLRNTHEMNISLHMNKWQRKIGREIKDKNIIIFGYGRIGRKVSSLLQSFEANVYFVDPFIRDSEKPENLLSRDDAIKIADIITIHVNEDKTIINKRDFEKMKKGILLLNCSRGQCISESDLVDAVKNEIVAGAWIDTFEKEPYEGPLLDLKNIILSPHSASFTKECRNQMELEATKNILSFLESN